LQTFLTVIGPQNVFTTLLIHLQRDKCLEDTQMKEGKR